jgi:hypothetical protein
MFGGCWRSGKSHWLLETTASAILSIDNGRFAIWLSGLFAFPDSDNNSHRIDKSCPSFASNLRRNRPLFPGQFQCLLR